MPGECAHWGEAENHRRHSNLTTLYSRLRIVAIAFLSFIVLPTSSSFGLTLTRQLDPGWSLVSVPIDPLIKDVTTLFDAFPRPLKVSSYVGNRLEIPQQGSFPQVNPGRAFWIYLDGAEQLEVVGTLTKSDSAYDIELTRGWNLMGNPWGVSLDWEDSQAAFLLAGSTDSIPLSQAVAGGHLDGPVQQYDQGTWTEVVANATPAQTLLPWVGYALYANRDGTLRLTPPAADNAPPVVDILSPGPASELTTFADIIGTASDTDLVQYSLQYAPAGSDVFTTFAAGNASVVDATLGVFDPTLLMNGQYRLRLLASDLAGNNVGIETSLLVDGGQKVGNFSISYVDLSLPMAEMPIQVVRTYDSRDKRRGDFGVGWTLEIGNMDFQSNRAIGLGWNGTRSSGSFPTYCLEEAANHVVSIAFPDGTVQRFEPVLTPLCQSFFPIQDVSLSFRPRPGSQGKLEPRGDSSGFVSGSWPGPMEILDYDTAMPLDITAWRYTTQNDLVLEFSEANGLERIISPNGNMLTIQPDGISHSAGKGIVMERDNQNRITRITDPMGSEHLYEYDNRGDLIAYTNPLGQTAHYTYNRKHFLLDVRDPKGQMAIRNEYNSDGRLVATTDAKGNRVEVEHDVEGNQQLVRDPMGNISRYVYDDEGNVIVEEKSVTIEGQTVLARTEREYDSENNLVVVVDPDGVRTEYEYDSNNNQTRITEDPGGLNLVTFNDYGGGCCRLQSTTDPNGNITTYTYNDNGRMTSQTDPLGHVTLFEYDDEGREIRQTNPLGNYTETDYDEFGNMIRQERYDSSNTLLTRDEFDYDENNNKLTETYFVTVDGTLTPVTTFYAYNALGQVVAATDPLGGVTAYEYDANNQQIASTDPLGRRTETEYDANGDITRATYPDGTFEAYAYDANGNQIEERSRIGFVTQYEYDELNRRVKTIHPDGSVEETVYTPGGRVSAQIDPNGNRTDFVYDAAGRQIRTLQPVVIHPDTEEPVRPEVVVELDPSGYTTARIDANGHRTEFEYDALGRVVVSHFPDGATTSREYSATGLVVSETDAEGRATHYRYDALNQLLEIQLPEPEPGAGRPTTIHTYDERGNRLSQTDALGRTTRFEHNILGQEVARILPDGASMTFTIDLAGRIRERKDYNGEVVRYDYDVMDNLIRTRYPDGTSTEVAYNAADQVVAMTDTRGRTDYTYDDLSQLTRVDHPDGTFIEYLYDRNGNRVRTTTPTGAVDSRYDGLNRLLSTRDARSQTVYFYDLAGNRVRQLVLPQGALTEYTYDSVNRLTGITHARLESDLNVTPLESYDYVVSPMGNRLQVTEMDGSVVEYTYDGLYRLTGETRTGSAAYAITYEYDTVGNRTRMVRNGNVTDYTYDDRDLLLTENAITCDYDANGNLIEKQDGADVTTYTYDYENRLIEKDSPSGLATYTYDGQGELVEVVSASETLRFLVDKQNGTGYSQTLEERNGNGDVVATYTYGHDLISMFRGGATSVYLYDGQMSTRLLMDAFSEISDTWTYDAFGRVVSRTGNTANRYLYTGERFDPNSGFYYLRARYYNPRHGRFMAMDPFDGRIQDPLSLHKYLYAHANPIVNFDPSGRYSLGELAVGLASRGVQLYNQYKFICKVKTGALVVSEVAFWTQVLAAAAVFTSDWKVGAAFKIERLAKFNKEQVKKVEVRVYAKPGSQKVYLQLNIEKVSGTRLQFQFNVADPSDNSFKFGKNYNVAEFAVCGSAASLVKIDLAFRVEPLALGGPLSNPNATPLDYATSYWSLGFDVTVLSFFKLSFPIFGSSSFY